MTKGNKEEKKEPTVINNRYGPSGLVLICMLLIWLKAYDKIDWSWWIVFAPLWVPPLTGIIALVGIGLFMLVMFLLALILDR